MSLFAIMLSGCVDNNIGNEDVKTPKEKEEKNEKLKTRISLSAGIEAEGMETRTDFSDPLNPVWSEGDAIGVHFNVADEAAVTNHHRLEGTFEDNYAKAIFSGDVELAEGDYVIYGYHPHGEVGENTLHHAEAKIEVPAVQHPTATSFDPAADVMVMMPVEHSHNGTDIAHDGLRFKRSLGMIKIILDSDELNGEPIENLTFTTDNAALHLAGMGHFDLTDASFGGFYDGAVNYVTAEPSVEVRANGTDAIMLCVPAVTIDAGVTMTITGETENFTFETSKTLDAPIVLQTGNWHTMNVVTLTVTPKAPTPEVVVFDNIDHADYYGAIYGAGSNFDLGFIAFGPEGGWFIQTDLLTTAIDESSDKEYLDIPTGEYPFSATFALDIVVMGDYTGLYRITPNFELVQPGLTITGGTMTVSGDHNNYSITFDITHSEGILEGSYNGPIMMENPNYVDPNWDYEALLGAYTATGVPSYSQTPGPGTWEGEIVDLELGHTIYGVTNGFGSGNLHLVDIKGSDLIFNDDVSLGTYQDTRVYGVVLLKVPGGISSLSQAATIQLEWDPGARTITFPAELDIQGLGMTKAMYGLGGRNAQGSVVYTFSEFYEDLVLTLAPAEGPDPSPAKSKPTSRFGNLRPERTFRKAAPVIPAQNVERVNLASPQRGYMPYTSVFNK